MRGPTKYTVVSYNGSERTNENEKNRGDYDTLEEALGCVAFDGLTNWEVWRGDSIAAESK